VRAFPPFWLLSLPLRRMASTTSGGRVVTAAR
jgi:hypothetical protein